MHTFGLEILLSSDGALRKKRVQVLNVFLLLLESPPQRLPEGGRMRSTGERLNNHDFDEFAKLEKEVRESSVCIFVPELYLSTFSCCWKTNEGRSKKRSSRTKGQDGTDTCEYCTGAFTVFRS